MAKAPDITNVTSKLYAVLQPLDAEMRARAIKAVFAMLGESAVDFGSGAAPKSDDSGRDDSSTAELHVKARTWMRTNSVSRAQIDHVFHREEAGFEILGGEVPGKSDREKTINAYMLTGIAQFLLTGEAKCADKSARTTCNAYGCFQATNHAKFLKATGNVLTGSKAKGWTVTGPGLRAVAEVLKEMSPA